MVQAHARPCVYESVETQYSDKQTVWDSGSFSTERTDDFPDETIDIFKAHFRFR